MGTPPRSRPGAASRFGTTDRPATSTGLLHRPTSSSFAVKTAGPGRSSLAHDAIEERPSRRPATSSNATANNRGLGSRPMSASKERLMGQYSSLGKLAMATPRAAPGGKENRWDGVPGSARRRPTTPRDLYDYNGRRIDPSARRRRRRRRRARRSRRGRIDGNSTTETPAGEPGARHRTNATEHGGERAPAPVHRARSIRQAGIRQRRPEDHSRRAAATRRREAGGVERRRRDDDS